MASSELGSAVDTQLTALNIDTAAEVKSFRVPGPRRTGNMATVLAAIQSARGQLWVSRKRVRSDALRLYNEGAL